MIIPKTSSERGDLLQQLVKTEIRASGSTYEQAFAAVAKANPELFAAMQRSAHNQPLQVLGEIVSTTMNRLGEKQRAGASGNRKPAGGYPEGFAGGPQVNALRAAGTKI